VFAFAVNAVLIMLLSVMERPERKKIPRPTQCMFYLGFVYGAIGVLPSFLLYTDLPCHCDDAQYNGTILCQGMIVKEWGGGGVL
jgi:hypothetical protein